MNEVWVVTGRTGEILHKGDTFVECFNHFLKGMKDPDFEELFDRGIIAIKISKVRRRPFKILREVEITIHDEIKRDEIKRKECETNASTEDHSCDDLFKEW